jgi:phenylpyruvate tautomerase PptA (4-oxalocrotonate tautomerase family)
MPLYTVSTQSGVLMGEARAALAEELTAFHCAYSGVPRTWVHVIFQEYAPGNGYTAGKAAAAPRSLGAATAATPQHTHRLAACQ